MSSVHKIDKRYENYFFLEQSQRVISSVFEYRLDLQNRSTAHSDYFGSFIFAQYKGKMCFPQNFGTNPQMSYFSSLEICEGNSGLWDVPNFDTISKMLCELKLMSVL